MTNIRNRYRLLRIVIPPVFVLWTITMLALTLLPGDAIPSVSLFSYDKVGHFGMFGGWTFFLGLYIIVYRENVEINLYLLAMAGILFGASIEVLQYLLPTNRTASWGDIVANTLGCITAILVLHPLKNFLKSKQ